jgi:hypothetical protein
VYEVSRSVARVRRAAGADDKEDDMLNTFLKVAGPLLALLGAGGAAVPSLAGALGTGSGGNLVRS